MAVVHVERWPLISRGSTVINQIHFKTLVLIIECIILFTGRWTYNWKVGRGGGRAYTIIEQGRRSFWYYYCT